MKDEIVRTKSLDDEVVSSIERLQALGISSIKLSMQQSPTPANHSVAICQTDVTHQGRTVSMPGSATPATSRSDEPHVLLTDAAHVSLQLAERCVRGMRVSPSAVSPARETTAARPRDAYQPQQKHSARLPMSEKQANYIRSLAQQKGMEAEDVAKDTVGKSIDQCSSADANKIIGYLKDDTPF